MRILVLLALLLTACKTAPAVVGGSDRALFTEDPLVADWQQWTPKLQPSTPAALTTEATAFDYWQVTDVAQREEVWAAIFGLLGEVRRVAPRDYEATFRMLMTVLEPDHAEGAQRLDATFFAAKRGSEAMFEGVGWRLWRELPSGATPGVTVWMRRYAASPEHPVEAFVWFYGGFEEAKSMTLRLDGRANWAMSVADGIGTSAATPISGQSQLIHGILLSTFWQPVIGAQYLETALEKRELSTDTPDQQPLALGLELGDRDIDQVFSDSVFAPRLTLYPSKQDGAP